jgi:hypothetical protein
METYPVTDYAPGTLEYQVYVLHVGIGCNADHIRKLLHSQLINRTREYPIDLFGQLGRLGLVPLVIAAPHANKHNPPSNAIRQGLGYRPN